MAKKLPIFYSTLLLTGVNLLLRFVATSFQVFLSGRIGASGIGLLQLVLSVGALALTVGMAGIRTATMYLTAEELGKGRQKNVRWVLSGCFGYSIVCSGLMAICLYIFAPFLAHKWVGDPQTAGAIRLYGSILPVICLCGVMTGYFTAANRIGTLAAVEVAEQLLYMAVTTGALYFWAGNDPGKACQAVVLGSGVSSTLTLLSLVLLRLRERETRGLRIRVTHRLLKTAVPLGLGDTLKAGINTVENLMVPRRLALFSGIDDPLAAFGTVCGMVFPVMMFPAAIVFGLAELLIPELARCNAAGSKTRIQYLAKRSLKIVLLYGLLMGGGEYLLADFLGMRLYSSPEAGRFLRLYALLIPMLYCDAITDAMVKGLGQQTYSVRYNIFTSLLDVVLLFILLPHYAMVGYFWSFLITHAINFLLSLGRLKKVSGVGLELCLVLRGVVAAFAGVWICTAVSVLAGRVLGFLVIFACLLYLFGVISKEDWCWVRALVKK